MISLCGSLFLMVLAGCVVVSAQKCSLGVSLSVASDTLYLQTTKDGGRSFSTLGHVTADNPAQGALAYVKATNTWMLATNGNQVFTTTTPLNVTSWVSNPSINKMQYCGLVVHEAPGLYASPSGRTIIFSCFDGTLGTSSSIISNDAGSSWTPMKSGVWNAQFLNEKTIVAQIPTYSSTSVVVSVDGGNTWSNVTIPTTGVAPNCSTISFSSVAASDSKMFVSFDFTSQSSVCNYGYAEVLQDGKAVSHIGAHLDDFSNLFFNKNYGVAYPSFYSNSTSNIFKSQDGGATWTMLMPRLPCQPWSCLVEVAAVSDDGNFFVVMDNQFYVLEGNSWVKVASVDGQDPHNYGMSFAWGGC